MARTFTYEFSTSEAPEEAQARLRSTISERLRRPGGGSTASNLHGEMRLAKQTATSLSYEPKLRVPMPIATTIWLGRRLSGQHVEVTFAPAARGTHIVVSRKLGGGGEVAADREFWAEALNAD